MVQAAHGGGPSARDGAAMGALGARVVLFGGEDQNHTPLGDTWEWDGAWHAMNVSGPAPSAFAAMATLGDVVVMTSATSTTIETWLWDGSGWTAVEGQEPPSVGPFNLATLGGFVYTFPFDGSIWKFDGHAWSEVNDPYSLVPFPGPMTSTATTVVIMGSDGFPTNESWIATEILGNHWSDLTGKSPTARAGHALAPCGDAVVVFGGHDANNATLDDTWVWRSSGWERKEVIGPPARMGAAMAAW